MGKKSKIHFLTSYIEYLFDNGIKSEDDYLGDASRFLRFMLTRVSEDDLSAFLSNDAHKASYEKRLRRNLRKFYQFSEEHLDVKNEAFRNI